MNPEALDADCAALAAAGSVAEEALALHCEALAILEQGWHSQSGSAATDVLRRQCGEAAELVTALHDATGDFRALRDAAEYGAVASTAEPYNRLSDRPPTQFETAEPFFFGGAAAPVPPPVPPPAPVWTPATAVPPLPDLGGALVGLVAQIAEAVSLISVEEGADLGTAESTAQRTDPPTDPPPIAAPPKPESPAVPPVSPPVQFVGPSAPPEPAPPPIAAPPPLLAAERPPDPPPEPRPASPPAPEVPAAPPEPPPEPPPEDPKTPCEIAADALPQVGK